MTIEIWVWTAQFGRASRPEEGRRRPSNNDGLGVPVPKGTVRRRRARKTPVSRREPRRRAAVRKAGSPGRRSNRAESGEPSNATEKRAKTKKVRFNDSIEKTGEDPKRLKGRGGGDGEKRDRVVPVAGGGRGDTATGNVGRPSSRLDRTWRRRS